MALRFISSYSQRLSYSSALVTAAPFTIASWVKPTAEYGDGLVAAFINASTEAGYYFSANETFVSLGAGNGYAATSTGITLNTWGHACVVEASSTSRAAYVNGGGKATDTTASGTISPTITRVCCDYYEGADQNFQDIDLADLAIWNVALTDAEVAALAAGASPLSIRPSNLVAYYPLYGPGAGTQRSISTSGLALTESYSGTNFVNAPHAPTQRPFSRIGGWRGANLSSFTLTASGLINSAPDLSAPALSTAKQFTIPEVINDAPVIGTPALTTNHVTLLSTGFAPQAPVLGAPTITECYTLSAAELAPQPPVLGSSFLGEGNIRALTAANFENIAPVLPSMSFGYKAILLATNLIPQSPILQSPIMAGANSKPLTAADLINTAPVIDTTVIKRRSSGKINIPMLGF